jgi:hypothetical protein
VIANPLRVRELLDEIEQGDVLLPEIQRAYVWKGTQVTKLIDSLYREYPSGQILLWDTINLTITKNLEGVEKPPLPSASRPKIVLDGQQRLTSLYQALGRKQDGLQVYFNLETEQFQLYSTRLNSDPRWISVSTIVNNQKNELDILDEIETAGWVTAKDPQKRVYLDRLQRLRKIGDYKFPIEVFRSDDYEAVTELFVRINSGGTHLRAAELVLAQLALRLPGVIVRKFEQALEDYSDMGYELDTRFLTRAFIAVGTGQSRFRYIADFLKNTSPKELEKVWDRTRKAVDSAVNFVRQNAGFESSDWLSSFNALIPLAAYFEKHSAITPDVEAGLLRWFYTASLYSRYSGSSETALDEDLKAVASSEPASRLLRNTMPVGRNVGISPEEFDDAGSRNSLFPLTYAAARKNRAKDWFTGVMLSTDVVGQDHEVQVHHVFPKALLNRAGVSRKNRDEIANFAFLAARPNRQISMRPPSQYLAEIAAQHPERLEAQSIPMDSALWQLDRFPDFLMARRKLLAAAVNDLIASPNLAANVSAG